MSKRQYKILDHTFFLLLSSIFLQSFSFLSIKFSTMQEGIYAVVLLMLSFIFIGIRAYIWQILLQSIALSKIYPLTSLVQVLILIYSVVFFNENINMYHMIGLTIMITGIYHISRKDNI